MTGDAGGDMVPELSIVIPTRDRAEVLELNLRRLLRFAAAERIEVIVVDDGSSDDTAARAESIEAPAAWSLRVARQPIRGPAAARNLGVALARADVCLLLGDDSLPDQDLVSAHLGFHRERPAAGDACLGLVVPAPPLDASPFIRWLHEDGTQFGYGELDPGLVPALCFWTANVSLKRELFERSGGFDESFTGAAGEDAELGLRLARHGMRLRYVPGARSLHFHPTDLTRTLERMRAVGIAFRTLCELAPEIAEPSRPGPRHRLRAAALEAACAAGLRSDRTRRAAWRFLCDEVQREAYWGFGAGDPAHPAIGSRLAARALADPLARPFAHGVAPALD